MNNFFKITTIGLCALALVGVSGCSLVKLKDNTSEPPKVEQPAGEIHTPNLPSDWLVYDETASTYQVVKGTSELPADLVIPSTYDDGVNGESLVTSIGGNAFVDENSLTSIIIPNTVTNIASGAICQCSALTEIVIPASVTTIEMDAILGCENLASIVVDSENTVYDSRNNCNAIIETATNTLLKGCQSTIIPDTVTSIGNGAFTAVYNLYDITIPNSVTHIGMVAFAACSGLTSITIPASVTSIGGSPFVNCSNLTSIIMEATTPPEITHSFLEGATCSIFIPAGTLDTYTSAPYWDTLADRLVELED